MADTLMPGGAGYPVPNIPPDQMDPTMLTNPTIPPAPQPTVAAGQNFMGGVGAPAPTPMDFGAADPAASPFSLGGAEQLGGAPGTLGLGLSDPGLDDLLYPADPALAPAPVPDPMGGLGLGSPGQLGADPGQLGLGSPEQLGGPEPSMGTGLEDVGQLMMPSEGVEDPTEGTMFDTSPPVVSPFESEEQKVLQMLQEYVAGGDERISRAQKQYYRDVGSQIMANLFTDNPMKGLAAIGPAGQRLNQAKNAEDRLGAEMGLKGFDVKSRADDRELRRQRYDLQDQRYEETRERQEASDRRAQEHLEISQKRLEAAMKPEGEKSTPTADQKNYEYWSENARIFNPDATEAEIDNIAKKMMGRIDDGKLSPNEQLAMKKLNMVEDLERKIALLRPPAEGVQRTDEQILAIAEMEESGVTLEDLTRQHANIFFDQAASDPRYKDRVSNSEWTSRVSAYEKQLADDINWKRVDPEARTQYAESLAASFFLRSGLIPPQER
jgi:hypothetical protein